jgi:hypothetical protein
MNRKIDLKSVLMGTIIGIAVTVAIGATTNSQPFGRFQVGCTGNHAIILDTATGQAWTGFFSSSGGRSDGERFFTPKLGETK